MVALRAGTFEARSDSHLSWTPLIVDEEGWNELAALLAETLEGVIGIQARSAGRLAETGVAGTPAAVTLVGYEASPQGSKQRGR